jgi:hypothetical protein
MNDSYNVILVPGTENVVLEQIDPETGETVTFWELNPEQSKKFRDLITEITE